MLSQAGFGGALLDGLEDQQATQQNKATTYKYFTDRFLGVLYHSYAKYVNKAKSDTRITLTLLKILCYETPWICFAPFDGL